MPNVPPALRRYLHHVPPALRPYAVELFQAMRGSQDLTTLSDEALADLVTSPDLRQVLENYAAGRQR